VRIEESEKKGPQNNSRAQAQEHRISFKLEASLLLRLKGRERHDGSNA
jgi:hypothetical protein